MLAGGTNKSQPRDGPANIFYIPVLQLSWLAFFGCSTANRTEREGFLLELPASNGKRLHNELGCGYLVVTRDSVRHRFLKNRTSDNPLGVLLLEFKILTVLEKSY